MNINYVAGSNTISFMINNSTEKHISHLADQAFYALMSRSTTQTSLLQRIELRTSELLLSDIVALQEELAGFIVDHVANPDAEFCVI